MWQNLIAIWQNLPLILSDTTDPRDVSLNRVVTVAVAVVILLSPPIVWLCFSDWWDKFFEAWKLLLAFLGAQTAGNIFVKYKKCGGENNAAGNNARHPGNG